MSPSSVRASILSLLFLLFTPFVSFAEDSVCITSDQATDLIQILDASDKNLEALESCNALVDQLYSEIKIRDEIIERLTLENIELKKEIRHLKKTRDREKILRYAGIGAIIFSIIKVAASVAAI